MTQLDSGSFRIIIQVPRSPFRVHFAARIHLLKSLKCNFKQFHFHWLLVFIPPIIYGYVFTLTARKKFMPSNFISFLSLLSCMVEYITLVLAIRYSTKIKSFDMSHVLFLTQCVTLCTLKKMGGA